MSHLGKSVSNAFEDPPEDSFKPDTKLPLNVKARLVAEELAGQQLMLLLLVHSHLGVQDDI